MRRVVAGAVVAAGLALVALLLAAGAASEPARRRRRRGAAAVAGPATAVVPVAAPVAPVPRLRRLRRLRPLALFFAWAPAGAIVVLMLALAGSWLAGYRSLTVVSGSMEPAISTGDVVVNRTIAPLDARPGDVVTFRDPGGDASITHRVRSVEARGGSVSFVTKGDANTAAEHWTIAASGEIGRVEYRIPMLGYTLFWAGGRWARIVLVTIPALLLGALVLAGIWRPRDDAADR